MALSVKYPTYMTTLPISKKKVSYRPFNVKEEKMIVTAIKNSDEPNIPQLVEQLVNVCTFGKEKIKNLPLVDLEYLFLQIRSKSVGEIIEGNIKCSSCGKSFAHDMKIEEIKIIGESKQEMLKLSSNTVITVAPPAYGVVYEDLDDLSLAIHCIKQITIDDEVYDASQLTLKAIRDFVEELPAYQFKALEKYVNTMPYLVYSSVGICPHCNHENKVHLEGLENFFL